MPEYRVTWAVDVDAEDIQKAAFEAEQIMMTQILSDITGPCFTIVDKETNKSYTVDLEGEEHGE